MLATKGKVIIAQLKNAIVAKENFGYFDRIRFVTRK